MQMLILWLNVAEKTVWENNKVIFPKLVQERIFPRNLDSEVYIL